MTTSTARPDDGYAQLHLSADEVLTTTRAVRKRLDLSRPVPRGLIEDCVAVAAQAPSGRNRQQWDFIVVDDPAQRAEVADIWRAGLMQPVDNEPVDNTLPSRVSFDHPDWDRIASSLRHLATNLHDVPALVIPCLRVSSRAELGSIRGQAGGWGSAVPAVWSFMLAARERGLGTCWTTCHLTYEKEMADVLGIPFEQVVQVALTPLAYTIGTDFKVAIRADTTDFIHWDRW